MRIGTESEEGFTLLQMLVSVNGFKSLAQYTFSIRESARPVTKKPPGRRSQSQNHSPYTYMFIQ